MPRGLLNWAFKDIQDFLKANGFQLHHIRGSHHYFTRLHRGRLYLTHVAYHGSKSIPPDTLRAIIRQSGIPKEQWIAELPKKENPAGSGMPSMPPGDY